jgi:hypothetical protein
MSKYLILPLERKNKYSNEDAILLILQNQAIYIVQCGNVLVLSSIDGIAPIRSVSSSSTFECFLFEKKLNKFLPQI